MPTPLAISTASKFQLLFPRNLRPLKVNLMRTVLCLFAVLLFAMPSFGQCSNGSCSRLARPAFGMARIELPSGTVTLDVLGRKAVASEGWTITTESGHYEWQHVEGKLFKRRVWVPDVVAQPMPTGPVAPIPAPTKK
jgi:hypothetical protein